MSDISIEVMGGQMIVHAFLACLWVAALLSSILVERCFFLSTVSMEVFLADCPGALKAFDFIIAFFCAALFAALMAGISKSFPPSLTPVFTGSIV